MASRIGVRGRLLLAFFGISAFALLAVATAMYSFFEVDSALNQITEDRVPSTIASQQLSRQGERIAAAAPALLTVDTPEEHKEASDRISADLDRLNELLNALRNRNVDRVTVTLIEDLVNRLGRNLMTLDGMIEQKLVFVERRSALLRDLRFADLSSRRLLAPGILVMDAKLAELRRAVETLNTTNVSSDELADLADPIIASAPLQQVRAGVSTIHDMLVEAASARAEADLEVLVVPLRRALGELDELMTGLEPDLATRLRAPLEKFREFVDAPDGIIAARRDELRHLGLMQALLDESIEISRQLTEAMDQLVFATDTAIRDANREAQSVQQASAAIMISVVVLSLACSGLIVWLYVDRNLIARLRALSNSMRAIAGGNLETSIPSSGRDEIADMAQALVVFRDTAREVRETNLREIREARRRLIDAIESIAEGFSLYDAKDALVLCNSRYRDDLYAGIADIVVPGVAFETILRSAAERGLVRGAEARVDEWISERLAFHRNPAGVLLQQQSDGRWIQIDERKTEDGGTVAVYADITQIKKNEQELAAKSNALEQLSNQLAKYLSPQVYDSIFSGRQEVRVTSTRKKLTIFFSDIAGFTETVERLESEDLAQLLNHYLTEMSQIAIERGATIDKYMGDSIVAFFGDPESRGVREDALACVYMAMAMRRRLSDLERIWRDAGIEKPLKVRMGIHTGFCTVGNFGSEDRMDYTIIGSAVNTASRLETAAEPGDILISYETFSQVRDQVHCMEQDQIQVKGVAHPITVYKVVGPYEELEQERHRFRTQHPAMRLDLDLDAMTPEGREQAADTLRRALDLLCHKD